MKKILFLDDDMETLNLVKLVLSYSHYKVKAINKWEIFQATLDNFIPDLILLDIVLDGADGSEICRKLKGNKVTQHIPVVLVSAYPAAKSYLKDCNAQAFLSKPFEMPNLLKTVKHNLATVSINN